MKTFVYSIVRSPKATKLLPLVLFALVVGGCGNSSEPTATPTNLPPVTPSATATVPPPPTETDAPASAPVQLDNDQSTEAVGDGGELLNTPYPAPVAPPSPTSGQYPPPATATVLPLEAYPSPQTPTPETSRIPIVPFVLERPLNAGDTVIRGTGPANIPILVVDIFLMGEELGEGIIDAEGNFEVTVPALESGHWIGVAVNDLSETDLEFEDFYARGFRGPGAEQVPQVGFVYDSEFVQ